MSKLLSLGLAFYRNIFISSIGLFCGSINITSFGFGIPNVGKKDYTYNYTTSPFLLIAFKNSFIKQSFLCKGGKIMSLGSTDGKYFRLNLLHTNFVRSSQYLNK